MDDPSLHPEVVRKKRQYEISKRLLVVSLILVLVAVTGLFAWALYNAYRTQERIEDCTTPGRACYEQQTGALFAKLETLIERQERLQSEGSVPAQENARVLRENQANIKRILDILERLEARQSGPAAVEAARPAPSSVPSPPSPSSPQPRPASPSTTPSAPAPTPSPGSSPPEPDDEPDPIIGCLPLVNVCI